MLVLLSLINNKDLTCNPLFKYKLITNISYILYNKKTSKDR